MSLKWTIKDNLAMTRRNMLRYVRLPQLLIFSTIQPVMFVLLFAYVFGGAIKIPGQNYISYLLPGILVQTVLFGATQTGIGLADDLSRGMIDRFRALPMASSAVLGGRTASDVIRNIFVVILMAIVGLIIGFRWEHGFFHFAGALGLIVLFGFAFSWISAAIGLAVRNIETAQVAGFIWVFPLAFISSIFVPVQTMPRGLKSFADANPVTQTVNAARALSLGGPAWTSVWHSLVWVAVIIGIFAPIAITQYRKMRS
jgi:ABC-2 type transport system permease protein/oleandomycin transport system permease protein